MRRWPLVRARPLPLPRHGRILTPNYASPEQLEGAPITTANAVYALGVVLSELLASDRPFCSKSGNYQQPVIGANSGAQKIHGNYCTICCTIPASGGWLAGSLAIPSSQRDDVSADR